MHKRRIGAKKLRYVAEFARELYPKKRLKRLLKRLTGLQDLLGEMSDARTARNLLDGLYHKWASNAVAVPLAHGARFIEGATMTRTQADGRQLKRQWRRCESDGPRFCGILPGAWRLPRVAAIDAVEAEILLTHGCWGTGVMPLELRSKT